MRLDNFIVESSQMNPYNVVVDVYNRSMPYIMNLIREFHHINLKTPMLLSGRKSNDSMIIKNIRIDRQPKDTSYDSHLFVDQVFHEIFGINARSSSIFVTGQYSTANSYGDSVYGIFPHGTNYEILWSPQVRDLYSDALDSREYMYLGHDIEYIIKDILESGNVYDEARETLSGDFDNDHNRDEYESDDEYFAELDDYVENNYEGLAGNMAREQAENAVDGVEDSFYDMIRTNYKKGDLKQAIMSHSEIMLSGTSYTGVIYNYLPYLLRYMEVHGAKKPNPHLFDTAMVGIDFKKFPNDGTSDATYRKRIAKKLSPIDISDLKK